MAIPDFDRKYITEAFQIFDRDYREKEQLAKFTDNRNHKYAITHKNKLYPVKEIIRIAAQEAGLERPHFNGGKEANSFIRKRGFEIIDLKQYRQQNNREKLLEKEINWSMFEWGLTIPVKAHDNFYEANGRRLKVGASQTITLVIEGQEYEASLKNIDRTSKSETLQLRYDNNQQLKDLLATEFSFSQQYIIEERKRKIENGEERPQVKLPEDKQEFFKIYASDEEQKFIVELETIGGQLRTNLAQVLDEYYGARMNQQFAQHELGDLLRHGLPEIVANKLQSYSLEDDYEIKGSIGQGNWVKVPWLAIMDRDITTTTREGVYVVYSFAEDMSRVYLTLNQGVTNTSTEEQLQARTKLREELDLKELTVDNELELTDSGIGSDYETSTIAYLEYQADDLPSEEVLEEDLIELVDIYQQYKQQLEETVTVSVPELSTGEIIEQVKDYIAARGFNYPQGLIENFYLSLKTKPFVLLAGISGTGKTKLAQLFAEAIGCTPENNRLQIIPVRPDWSDPSDLLGYKDLDGNFRPGPMIDIIERANQNPSYPHFVCLDEMNLARVEYYFSDLLSTIETRKQMADGIKSAVLLEEDYFKTKADKEQYAGLRIPDNLYLIGTVNMDETTHPFSKKVLDRANTIEFSEVELANFNLSQQQVEALGDVENNFLAPDYLTLNDCAEEKRELINQVVERLQEVNEILKLDNLHVGYRVRDEVCFYMIYNQRQQLLDFDAAIDYQLQQKILPRIQGSSNLVKEILVELFNLSSGADLTADNRRVAGEALAEVESGGVGPYPQSAEKIAYMIKRFEEDGFTAYWL
jgi:DNA polymerase III delta prime subunit